MRYSRYDIKDFLAIKKGDKTVQEIAEKYKASNRAIICAMARVNVFRKKKMVKVTTPYKEKICSSINECAEFVGVSSATISNALKGQQIPILKELEIKVEEYEPNAEEEYDY